MIGIVIPTEYEAKALIARLRAPQQIALRGRTATRGLIGKNQCMIVISGIGKVLCASATQQLIDHASCEALFHLGSAGALSPELKIGDFILGEEIIEHDHYSLFGKLNVVEKAKSDSDLVHRILKYADSSGKKIFQGSILSGTEDIVTTKRRDELYNKFAGLSVDWESFAFAKVCNVANLPCLVLRAISDYAYENTSDEFKKNFATVSAELCRFLADFLLKYSDNEVK